MQSLPDLNAELVGRGGQALAQQAVVTLQGTLPRVLGLAIDDMPTFGVMFFQRLPSVAVGVLFRVRVLFVWTHVPANTNCPMSTGTHFHIFSAPGSLLFSVVYQISHIKLRRSILGPRACARG